MTITAAAITGWSARVTFTGTPAWNAHPTMTISRVVGGIETPIIAGRSVPTQSGSWDDPEVPLNVPVAYRVASTSGTLAEVSEPITVTSDLPLVSDPWRGLTAAAILVTEGDREHDSRVSRVDVAGRAQRVRIWDVEAAARIQPELITTTAADLATWDQIMASGDPVLVRCVCGAHGGWWQRVGSRSVARLTLRGESRRHALADVDVLDGAPSNARPVGDTLGDLADVVDQLAFPTLGGIEDMWPGTLGDVAAADLRGML